jgi:large subunit ribosomal protein L5
MNIQKTYIQDLLSQDLALKRVISNCMQLTTINKVVLHTSTKQIIKNKKNAIPSQLALSLLAGQKPKSIYAKKSVAVFQLRKGQFLGWKITLRNLRMYQFLQKLVILALPQQRGFGGFQSSISGKNGNFHLGYNRLPAFPELESHFNILDNISGMDINIVTSTSDQKEANMLLSALLIPIKDQ